MTTTLPDSFIPDKLRDFIGTLVWCRQEYIDALTMALIVSHNKDAFTAVPYILATSDQPASGKSTIAFDIPMLLADNIESIDRTTTQPALNAMYLSRETPNTAWDDIGKIFGPNGQSGGTTNFYTTLVRSYKKNASTKLSRNGTMQKLSTYGMAFMNGLQDAVPKDLYTRAIHFKMGEAPDEIDLRDVMDDSVEAEAKILKEAAHAWAGARSAEFKLFMKGKVRRIHPKLVKRRRQKWGPLFAAAYAAGGDWPQRIFDAFITCELDASEKPVPVPEQFVVLDAAKVLMKSGATGIFTSDLMEALRALPEGKFYRDAEDEYLINRLFPSAFGEADVIHGHMLYGDYAGQAGRAKGYDAELILLLAADTRELLFPPMETDLLDPLEAELHFTPEKASA